VETFFTDDTCAEDSAIVYVRTTSCDSVEPGDIVYSIVGSSTCADRHRLYRLGDSVEPPAQLYWRNAATGACDLLPVQQSGAFHAVEPASPDSLVSFTERVHAIPGAEVQVYGLEGDDSSFVPLGFYEDGHPCYPVETTEGTRCLP